MVDFLLDGFAEMSPRACMGSHSSDGLGAVASVWRWCSRSKSQNLPGGVGSWATEKQLFSSPAVPPSILSTLLIFLADSFHLNYPKVLKYFQLLNAFESNRILFFWNMLKWWLRKGVVPLFWNANRLLHQCWGCLTFLHQLPLWKDFPVMWALCDFVSGDILSS